MIVRLFVGAGLFALGYMLGREVGRAESIRDQLQWATEEHSGRTLDPDPDPNRESDGDSTA